MHYSKQVSRRQLTVTWHVDDLKVSHQDSRCMTKTIQCLLLVHGNLTEQWGKKHDYSGIALDYEMPCVVHISIAEYMKEILRHFLEEINREVASPAPNHLLLLWDKEKATKLPEEQMIDFHHTGEKLLFLSTRVQRDIQVAVAVLTTTVKSPVDDDWASSKGY